MEELIKRLERVIQTGVPDKDGMHPISAETVLEVVKELSELSTNLAEVGTDCISRQQAINALERAKQNIHHNIERAIGDAVCEVLDAVANGIKQLPPIHPVNNSENPNGSDVISRQAAIDATKKHYRAHDNDLLELIAFDIEQLPSAQPEIIRCRNCKFASGDSRICMKFGHSPIGELDFCAWAERRTDE